MPSDPQIPPPLITLATYNLLQREFDVLHLIYLRSKNQFHSSVWWPALQALHKNLRNFIYLCHSYEAHLGKIQMKMAKFQKLKKKIEFMNHYETHVLERLQRRYDFMLSHFVKLIVPVAWRQFHGILAMNQFITLGFALLASLGKIHSIIQGLRGKGKGKGGEKHTSYVQTKNIELTSDVQSGVVRSLPQLANDSIEDLGQEVDLKFYKKHTEKVQQQQDKIALEVKEETVVKNKNNGSGCIDAPKLLASAESSVARDLKQEGKKAKETKSKKRKAEKSSDLFDDLFGDDKKAKKKKKKGAGKSSKDDPFGSLFG